MRSTMKAGQRGGVTSSMIGGWKFIEEEIAAKEVVIKVKDRMKNCEYPQRVGEDRILRTGERIAVYSKVDMDEWRIQNTRKTAIYINDEALCLVGKQFSGKDVCYLLEPWPDIAQEIPGRVIRYDEEYVKARDEAAKKRRLENGIGPLLYHVRFLIGFLPSSVKARIEADFGVSARDATIISIFIELLLFFCIGVWLIYAYGMFYWAQSGRFMYEYAVMEALIKYIPAFVLSPLILFIDVFIRYGSYLKGDRSPLGAYEWVWRWAWRTFPKTPQ